jgi:hypothetical protein
MISTFRYASRGDGRCAFAALIAEGFVVCDHSRVRSSGGCELVVMHNSDELDDVVRTAGQPSVGSQARIACGVTQSPRTTRGWATTWSPPMPWRDPASG